MKRNILSVGKVLLSTILLLIFSIIIVLPIPVVSQTNPKAILYLDPPTINGTAIGEEFTVNLMIRDAVNISSWQAGMIFNSDLLNCTGFFEGEFLKSVGSTLWQPGAIDNTAGVIVIHACFLLGESRANGSGRLAYLTFKVKAPGVSNIHLRDVKVWMGVVSLPVNIIDVFTVILDTTAHTVVIVSNSTGKTGWYHSGFYAHAYNPTLKTLSFNVTGPKPGFSNVTIPKTLLNATNLNDWLVIIDGNLLSTGKRTITENTTHTSIYFTYPAGIHQIQITTRVRSTISIVLSLASITLGSSVTISGNITADDPMKPLRPNITVTIQSRPIGAVTWNTVDTVKTDSNSGYTYTWTPETGGTHEVMASWEGDEETIGDESDTVALIVLYVFEPEGVYIETNSTVAEFNSIPTLDFSQPLKQISFNVTSPYGTLGYCNVTIPKELQPPSPTGWKVIINGTLLNAEDIIVTENITHTFVYFTYSKGFNIVEITTRMSSTILMVLSSDSIDLGSSVTISGNVTAEDHTARSNVTVTIQSRPIGSVTWNIIDTVETQPNGNYASAWTPGAAGIYKVMASWEGDEETIGAKSEVQTLTVIENSTISIALSSASVTFGSSVIISGEIDPLKPNMLVTIKYRLIGEAFWTAAGQNQTDQDSRYTFKWTPTTPGTYEVMASWEGDEITYGATSTVPTLAAKWTSTISITLSSPEITRGKSVTISGNITVADNIARENVTVTLLYKPSGGEWISLANVTTDANGNYTYSWKPDAAGTYEVMASWEGDDITFGNESAALPLTVKEAPPVISLEIVAVVVVAIIVIAAVVVYFVKFRKP